MEEIGIIICLKKINTEQENTKKLSQPYSGWTFSGLLTDGESVTHILQLLNLAQ